jgi:hypothetical protein
VYDDVVLQGMFLDRSSGRRTIEKKRNDFHSLFISSNYLGNHSSKDSQIFQDDSLARE